MAPLDDETPEAEQVVGLAAEGGEQGLGLLLQGIQPAAGPVRTVDRHIGQLRLVDVLAIGLEAGGQPMEGGVLGARIVIVVSVVLAILAGVWIW